MTNKPEPNTRAGEALLDSAVEQMGEALFNLSSRLKLAGTFTAGSPGDRNAVSYEKVVLAWQKLTGEIERSKLPTWDHYAEEPVTSDMVPRDVAESWKAKAENYQIERAELLADISDMMANHVENWPSPKRLKTAVALIDKTFHAQSAQIAKLQARLEVVPGWSEDADGIACRNDTIKLQDECIAKLQADGDKLAGAATALRDDMLMRAEMHKHRNNGELVVEAGNGVWHRINEALTEWEDRA